MKWFLMAFLIASLLVNGQAVASTDLNRQGQTLLERLNETRDAEDLDPVALDAELTEMARHRADRMHESGHLSHANLSNITRATDASWVGEAIGAYASPAAVFEAWMDSSGHRKVLMTKQADVVGVAYVGHGGNAVMIILLASYEDDHETP